MTGPEDRPFARRRIVPAILATTLVAAAVGFGISALLVSIFEHKQEAREPFFRVVDLTDETDDPAVWARNFPLQYDGYVRTVDMERTRFGGSEALPRTPTPDNPLTTVSRSRLDDDPRLRTMWAGYAFSVDFREERGHAYMLDDQTYTQRQKAAPQPGACLHCHASIVVPYRKLGGGDLVAGFEKMNPLPFAEARTLVSRPIACLDCHDPKTLELRVTRPAFLEGIRAFKALQGVADYDVNRAATRQEMRAFVCAQCHVEYYFKGPEKRLTYPWAKGLGADEILAYYDEAGFRDWEHGLTGAPALKAQHPEFEMWNRGPHARAGVTCADCHMPYRRVGALKISDHHIRSPLLGVNNACQTCHRVSEGELKARAELIQERTTRMRDAALDALIELIGDLAAARQAGATDDRLAAPRQAQRRAQFLLDCVEAENSCGFHAPQEAARVLLESVNATRRGQVALRETPP